MKRKPTGLSQRYVAALRKHLKDRARASLQPALPLGRQAVADGLETLELARHVQASQVQVRIQKRPDRICMKITDDGRAYQGPRALPAPGTKTPGLAPHERTVGDGRRPLEHRVRPGPGHDHRGADSASQGAGRAINSLMESAEIN